jgi:hypothetical protein
MYSSELHNIPKLLTSKPMMIEREGGSWLGTPFSNSNTIGKCYESDNLEHKI